LLYARQIVVILELEKKPAKVFSFLISSIPEICFFEMRSTFLRISFSFSSGLLYARQIVVISELEKKSAKVFLFLISSIPEICFPARIFTR